MMAKKTIQKIDCASSAIKNGQALRCHQRPGDIDATAAKAVRQPGEAGDGQAADPANHQADIQEQFTRQAEVLRRVVQGKRGDDIHRQQFTGAGQ
jgi:hypothetical protein